MIRPRTFPVGPSPFALTHAPALNSAKFRDPLRTATGAPRAVVPFLGLDTLWLNTGTLCNLACASCYIESSPTNDALVYLTAAEVGRFLAEAAALGVREVGFTGGEPFMNPEIATMLRDALDGEFEVLVLTNAMRPMRRHETTLRTLRGPKLTLRVSIDHHTAALHEAERGPGSWMPAMDGLRWLSDSGFTIAVAGRRLADEPESDARSAYAALFATERIKLDALDPARLVLFPAMDATADVAEISEACWAILGKRPSEPMCATSRMIVHRRGEPSARVVACTLVPYDPHFDLGVTLATATDLVRLNHPHCSRFCVLGGASCAK